MTEPENAAPWVYVTCPACRVRLRHSRENAARYCPECGAPLPEPVPPCSCGSRSLYAEDPPRLGPHHAAACGRYRTRDGRTVERHGT